MACSLLGAQWEGRAEGLSSAKGSRPPPRARVRVPRAVTTCLPSPLINGKPKTWARWGPGLAGAVGGGAADRSWWREVQLPFLPSPGVEIGPGRLGRGACLLPPSWPARGPLAICGCSRAEPAHSAPRAGPGLLGAGKEGTAHSHPLRLRWGLHWVRGVRGPEGRVWPEPEASRGTRSAPKPWKCGRPLGRGAGAPPGRASAESGSGRRWHTSSLDPV